MWDMSLLQVVPGLRIAAPRDADQVRAQLREAVEVDDAPTVVRYSKGAVGPAVAAVGRIGGMDVLREPAASAADHPDVLLVSVGALAPMCLEIADLLDKQGISATVVDPRWVKPVDEELPALAERHRVVVTVEDNSRVGGVGSAIAQALRDAGVDMPVRDFGIPPRFLDARLPQGGHGRDRADRTGHRPPGHRPGVADRRPLRGVGRYGGGGRGDASGDRRAGARLTASLRRPRLGPARSGPGPFRAPTGPAPSCPPAPIG